MNFGLIEVLIDYQNKWRNGDLSTFEKDMQQFNYIYNKKLSDEEQGEYHHILSSYK